MYIIISKTTHSALKIAAEEFIKYYKAITEREAETKEVLPETGDAVLLCGTDHPFADSRVNAESDAFSLKSVPRKNGNLLVITGGRPRAVLYGIYAFFESYGCSWFWDGDVIPEQKTVSVADFDLYSTPRFEYRAIRYFAHRGLHRLQAEHWSFEDWKCEIDWMVKSRLNTFMLRIGMDDIFQKAFPETVPYPSNEEVLPEAGDGYNNRTTFWSLKYRGELRKKVLSYAFERDILHPEDCGTMTHWYSRTPLAFLEKKKPLLLSQESKSYSEQTGLVWDIESEDNWKNYQHLTDTHIKEYGRPDIFHTIGLAERSYGNDRQKNMALKHKAYKKITDYVAKNYPDAPLWIAGWDFFFCYKAEEVRALVEKLDPKRHIIFDYTADLKADGNDFENWGVCGKFPWIFGLFHGYMPQSNVHGDYDYINKKLAVADNDPYCRGMAFWPELSHSDSLMLYYFTKNSWSPSIRPIGEWVAEFCEKRYGKYASVLKDIWEAFIPLNTAPDGGSYYMESFFHLFGRTASVILDKNHPQHSATITRWKERLEKATSLEVAMKEVVSRIGTLSDERLKNPFIKRDICDLLRTLAAKKLDYDFISAAIRWVEGEDIGEVKNSFDTCLKEFYLFADILALNNEFSLYHTFEKLKTVSEVNPHFEKAIKDNSVNYYCRSAVYEPVKYVYIPEMKLLTKKLLSQTDRSYPELTKEKEQIYAEFVKIPLNSMQPEPSDFAKVCNELQGYFKG